MKFVKCIVKENTPVETLIWVPI